MPKQDDFLEQRIRWENPFPTIVIPNPSEKSYIVFTDGTAFNGTHWDLCIAAGGYAVFDFLQYCLLTSKAEIVPGCDHSSFHGESWAIVLVLQNYYKCRIYSDCGAVVAILEKLMEIRPPSLPWWLNKHADIWNLILQHVLKRPVGSIHITKVRAHQKWEVMDDGEAKWYGYANAHVDGVVKKHIQTKYKNQLKIAATLATKRDKAKIALHDFHVYLSEVADRVFQKKNETHRSGINQGPKDESTTDFRQEIAQGPLIIIHSIDITTEDIEACPYTPVFAQRMFDWFRKLEWPDESMAGHDSRPCSLLELYADFVLSTLTLAPAQLIPKSQRRPGFKRSQS